MRKLAALISRLPTASQYWQERSQDPDYADELLEAKRAMEKAGWRLPEFRPRLSDWTPEVDHLADIADWMAQISMQVVALAGGSVSSVRATPRPLTAVESLRAAEDAAAQDELVAEVKQAQETWRRLHKGGDESADVGAPQ